MPHEPDSQLLREVELCATVLVVVLGAVVLDVVAVFVPVVDCSVVLAVSEGWLAVVVDERDEASEGVEAVSVEGLETVVDVPLPPPEEEGGVSAG